MTNDKRPWRPPTEVPVPFGWCAEHIGFRNGTKTEPFYVQAVTMKGGTAYCRDCVQAVTFFERERGQRAMVDSTGRGIFAR